MSRYDVNVLLYRLKKDRAFRERFRLDPGQALAGTDLTDEERQAFVRWNPRRLNELGGSLHLVLSIPDLSELPEADRAGAPDARATVRDKPI